MNKPELIKYLHQLLKTQPYDLDDPFLIPFYLVRDLSEIEFNGITDEELIIDFFVDSQKVNSYKSMNAHSLFEKLERLPDEVKQDIRVFLPIARYDITKYLYQAFIPSSERSNANIDDELSIQLKDLFSCIIKEKFLHEGFEMTDDINRIMAEDNSHLFKAYFDNGDIHLDILTYHQQTLLHMAVISNAFEIASFLISEGADVNALDYYQNTPLFEACLNGNSQLFELLINNGADPDIENIDAIKPIEAAILSENPAFMDYLLDHLPIVPADFIHRVSIIASMKSHQTKNLEYLFEKDFLDPNTVFTTREHFIDLALKNQNEDISLYIIHHPKFKFDTEYEDGLRLIHLCIRYHAKNVVKALVEMGVDFFDVTQEGYGVLEIASKHHDDELFDYFLQLGVPFSRSLNKLLETSIAASNMKVLTFLKSQNVNFNVLIRNQFTPMLQIIGLNDREIIDQFIDDIDVEFHNSNIIPMLLDPTYFNNIELTTALLKRKLDPNIPVYTKNRQYYALINAIHLNNLDLIKVLVEAGANVNVKAGPLITALGLAKQKKDKKIIEYLKENGAKGMNPSLIWWFLFLFGVLFIILGNLLN